MSYKLLIVEDEDLIRRGLIYSMDWRALDCTEIREAADGRTALAEIESFQPHIVIMDINIPFLSGLEVLEQTRERFGYSAIILTGYADFNYARRAMRVEAVRFLLKPVNFDDLAEAVESAKESCRRRQAYQEYCRAADGLTTMDLLVGAERLEVKSKPVHQILAQIEAHYPEKLTLHDLAGELHYSETFLTRKFKEEVHMGFSEYLTRYRLQKAIVLLRETDQSTERIAEACGFPNAKYFKTVFRKHVGCSPRAFSEFSK